MSSFDLVGLGIGDDGGGGAVIDVLVVVCWCCVLLLLLLLCVVAVCCFVFVCYWCVVDSVVAVVDLACLFLLVFVRFVLCFSRRRLDSRDPTDAP